MVWDLSATEDTALGIHHRDTEAQRGRHACRPYRFRGAGDSQNRPCLRCDWHHYNPTPGPSPLKWGGVTRCAGCKVFCVGGGFCGRVSTDCAVGDSPQRHRGHRGAGTRAAPYAVSGGGRFTESPLQDCAVGDSPQRHRGQQRGRHACRPYRFRGAGDSQNRPYRLCGGGFTTETQRAQRGRAMG